MGHHLQDLPLFGRQALPLFLEHDLPFLVEELGQGLFHLRLGDRPPPPSAELPSDELDVKGDSLGEIPQL